MRSPWTAITLVALSFVLMAGPATAGPPPDRGGFFIGFGVGGGSATPSSDLDRESSAMAAFRIGYAPQDELTLGLESAIWSKEVSGVTWSFSTATFGATYYPGNTGFYVKGGLGLGTVEVKLRGITASEDGLGVLAALGYEKRLTAKFALGGEGTFNLVRTDTLDSANFAGLNLMFNWYWSKG